MRILIATPLLPSQPGGPGQYAVGLKNSLESRGCCVETVAFQEVTKFPSGIRHIILFLTLFSRVRRADVVIVLDTLSIALPAVLVAFLCRKKIVVRAGGDFVWEQYTERTKNRVKLSEFYNTHRVFSVKGCLSMYLQKYVVLPLTSVLVFSTKWQREIWRIPYALKENKITVIENAYMPLSTEFEIQQNSRSIVWIGRDLFLKNTQALDQAIERVIKKFPSVVYKKYSTLSHTEVIQILRTSRALVIPSFSEVSPNLALEALALRVPVLLTADCGIKEVLADSVIWIDPMDVDMITACIEELMTDDGYTRAHNQTLTFKSTRTYNDVADDFLSIINSIT